MFCFGKLKLAIDKLFNSNRVNTSRREYINGYKRLWIDQIKNYTP